MNIKESIHYDPDTGVFTWKVGRNTHMKGKQAGYIDTNGYRIIQFDNASFKAHHVAWFLYYGIWPQVIVDHRNRNRSDNRISNLRLATKQQNNVNSKINLRGVYFYKGKWKAQIRAEGKTCYLGLHKTKEEAYEVIKKKHKELHGEFSPCE